MPVDKKYTLMPTRRYVKKYLHKKENERTHTDQKIKSINIQSTHERLVIILQFVGIVINTKQEDIPSTTTRNQKTLPLPSIIFIAQLEINHDHRDFNAGNEQQQGDEAQEAKHVVKLILPHGFHDEEQFHEYDGEGHDTTQCQGGSVFLPVALWGDLENE